MSLTKEPIDLIEAGRKFRGRISRKRFGADIVLLADEVVRPYLAEDELSGIRKCIEHMLNRLVWRYRIGFIPSPFISQLTIGTPHPNVTLIAQSVVRTAQFYRSGLQESVTNLRYILLGEFMQGLEWACDAVYRGVDIANHDEVPRLTD